MRTKRGASPVPAPLSATAEIVGLIAVRRRETRQRLEDVAATHAVAVTRTRDVLRVHGPGLHAFLVDANAVLHPRDAGSVRVLLEDPSQQIADAERVRAALQAVSLPVVTILLRYRHLLPGFGDPERYVARYQPLVDLADGRCIGYEALLTTRLLDEVVPATVLFELAGAAGQTDHLDALGRQAAFRGLMTADLDGLLFVNSLPSSIEVDPEAFSDELLAAAAGVGLAPDRLVIEIGETELVEEPRRLAAALEPLREHGVRVALDDIGSGYNSILSAMQLRPDVVKIDREVGMALPGTEAAAVTRAIVHLVTELGATTVLEGIETTAAARAARRLGIDWAQGFLFGRPARLDGLAGD